MFPAKNDNGSRGLITLVIPTRNRPEFLARLLWYYQQVAFTHRIVVADSGDHEGTETNAQVIASTTNGVRVRHQIFPPETAFFTKLAGALELLDTPYVALCADDDFITPTGIESAVAHLDAHPEYSVASGRSCVMYEQPSGGFLGRSYPQHTVDHDDLLQRVTTHLSNYGTTFYSVHRWPELLGNLRLVFENAMDYRFGELLLSCLSLLQGKAIVLDCLYMVRQGTAGSTASQLTSWKQFVSQEDYGQLYDKFRQLLAGELTRAAKKSSADVSVAIDEAFVEYLSTAPGMAQVSSGAGADHSWHSRKTQLAQKMKRVVQTVPEAAKAAFLDNEALEIIRAPRSAYRRLQLRRDEMSIEALLNTRSPFRSDFLRIFECLNRYPHGIALSASQA